jgi:hypothetical protein
MSPKKFEIDGLAVTEMKGSRRAAIENRFRRNAGEFVPQPPRRQRLDVKPGNEFAFIVHGSFLITVASGGATLKLIWSLLSGCGLLFGSATALFLTRNRAQPSCHAASRS